MKKVLIKINVSGLTGNATGLTGDVSGLTGYLDDAEITNEERARGIEISTLIVEAT